MLVAVAASFLFWTPSSASAANCAEASTAEGLHEFFQADDAAGLAGADYPHAIGLPDGRTLWYFQDAFFGSGSKLDGEQFAHNVALVQDGECFESLDAPGGDGDSWIGSWVETDLQNWLWPLDAELGADGHLWLFLAEVQNPNGDGAAHGALPVGTWVARYTYPGLRLVGMEPAPDPSRSLFGYSIVSDSEWSYLYGHCYRQFDTRGAIGFDADCSPHAYLARVPVGQFDQELEYWTSTGWSDDRGERKPVLSSEISMPVSVQRFGDVYVAASDEGDWFGDDVVVYTAPAPQGPWVEALRYSPDTACGRGCNNYGAFVLPDLEGDQVVIAQSNNARDMRYAFELASLYRASVRAVDVPGASSANLTRQPDLDLARAEPEPAPDIAREPEPETSAAPVDRGPTPAASSGTPTIAFASALAPPVGTEMWRWAGVVALTLLSALAILSAPVAGLHRRTLDATKPSTPPARDPVGGRRTT